MLAWTMPFSYYLSLSELNSMYGRNVQPEVYSTSSQNFKRFFHGIEKEYTTYAKEGQEAFAEIQRYNLGQYLSLPNSGFDVFCNEFKSYLTKVNISIFILKFWFWQFKGLLLYRFSLSIQLTTTHEFETLVH